MNITIQNDAQAFIFFGGLLVWTVISMIGGINLDSEKDGIFPWITLFGILCLFVLTCLALYGLVSKNL